MSKVSISIITATLNSYATISTCLNSIKSQSISVEHIVKDGGSTDGTLGIISQYSPDIKIISEQDKGIYDALNKGLETANGDVIGILHADDYYSSAVILEKVLDVFSDSRVDACYGDLVYVADDNEKIGARSEKRKDFTVMRYWKSGEYDQQKFY